MPRRPGSLHKFRVARAASVAIAVVLGAAGLATVSSGSDPPTAAAAISASAVTCTSQWQSQSPLKAGSLSYFTGVSGLSTGQLYAVGYANGGDATPLAAEWTNGTWTTQAVGSGIPGDTELEAVSMSSTTSGWAVGWTGAGGNMRYRTVALRSTGSAWSLVSTPNVGAANNLLLGVHSVRPTDAWAVGYSQLTSASPRRTLAEQWNGTRWKVVPTPNTGTQDNVLLAVSGTSGANLWAVGYSQAASGYRTVIEHYDGTAWSLVSSPEGGTDDSVLTAVSADSANDAWAVGYYSTLAGQYHALVEHYNGTSWSVAPLKTLTDTVDVLRGVVAKSPTNVLAVGSALSTATKYNGFSIQWNGKGWRHLSTPGAAATQLRAVTAASGGEFWSVGETAQAPSAYAFCAIGTKAASATGPSAPAGNGGGAAASLPDRALAKEAPAATETGSSRVGPTVIGALHRPSAASSSQPVVAVNRAVTAGLPQNTNTVGAAVADFGNGYPDIFYAGESHNGGIYLNNGTGKLTEIDSQDFPAADHRSCSTADAFGTGHTDIFCTVGAQYGNQMKTDDLFMEGASMTFIDEAPTDGLADPFARGGATTFVPTPGGLPDLFVGADPIRSDGLPDPNRFYVNTGHGFEDAPQFGLDQSMGADCATAGDYMGNGLSDLLVCTDQGLRLYENTGSAFVNVTTAAGLPTIRARDAIFADLNGDGMPDIVAVTQTELVVYLQEPNHTFSLAYSLKLTGGVSVAAGDVNGDGSTDLYLVQGAFGKVANEPDLMLINNGSGTNFTTMQIPQTGQGQGSLALPIDFVGNGLTDFLVLNGGIIARPGPSQLTCFYPAVAPAFTSATSTTFTRGSTNAFQVTTTGSPTPSIAEAGSLPTGVTFTDEGNGTAILSGNPSVTGSFPLTITASNGVTPPASQRFSLSVTSTP